MLESLKVKVDQVKASEDYVIEGELNVEEFETLLQGYAGYTPTSPLKIKLSISAMLEGVFVRGLLRTMVVAPCGRCSESFQVALDASVRSAFMPKPKHIPSDEDLELTDDDIELSYYEGDEIDLADFIHECLVLELPLYPRCELRSNGLCPVHGFDPAEYIGGEQPEERIDPWYASLKAIKDKQKG